MTDKIFTISLIFFFASFLGIVKPGSIEIDSVYVQNIKNNPVANLTSDFETGNIEDSRNSGVLSNAAGYLSNNWKDLHQFVEDSGIDLFFNYKGDYLNNIAGGNGTKNTFLNYFYMGLNFDLDRAFNSKGTKLYLSAIGTGGENFCNVVGTSQGISNIEAFGTWKIYEFWIEQNLIDERATIKFGLYDLNSEFDVRATSSFFINPSHGIGADFSQTGKNGPSIFPTTSLTLRAKYKSESNYLIQAAVLDGVPGDPENPNGTHVILNKSDGLLLTAETGYIKNEENFGRGFEKYVIGGWFYTSKFPSISDDENNAGTKKRNFGLYASAEKFLFSENSDSTQGLSAFLRAGYAEKDLNRFDAYFGAGFIYKGLFSERDEDILGLAVAIAPYSPQFEYTFQQELTNLNGPEINFELTYSIYLTGWLNIQPDLQYVINPTYCISSKYALVAGLRTSAAF